MSDADPRRLETLLESMLETQRLQLERQVEGLALQRELADVQRKHYERQSALLDRAEALQSKSDRILGLLPKAILVTVVLIVVVLGLTVVLDVLRPSAP